MAAGDSQRMSKSGDLILNPSTRSTPELKLTEAKTPIRMPFRSSSGERAQGVSAVYR